MTTNAFLTSLQTATQQLLATAHTELEPLELTLLNHKPGPTSWSILECLEHLNRYSRYYNPQLAKALAATSSTAAQAEVTYSWLGRKSIAMMRPENPKKQTTVKHMNPNGSQLGQEVLTEFVAHQTQLLALLHQAQTADLNRKAVPVEFFKLLKLQTGETLEFVVVHQQRHVQQALRVKAGLQVQLAC